MTKILVPGFMIIFALAAILLLGGRLFLLNTSIDLSGTTKILGLTISVTILVAGLYWLWRVARA